MRSARIGQAAIIIMIMVIAASCAATKEYSSKLFMPRVPVAKDSQVLALRFINLDMDSLEKNDDNWVSTEFMTGKDSLSKALALDKLSESVPAISYPVRKSENIKQTDPKNTTPVLVAKPTVENEPVARYIKPGDVRSKRTRE